MESTLSLLQMHRDNERRAVSVSAGNDASAPMFMKRRVAAYPAPRRAMERFGRVASRLVLRSRSGTAGGCDSAQISFNEE